MCGIVGHLGPQNSVDLVLEGLRRLEYRGYDSAGVSYIDEKNNLKVYKKSGKLENLQTLLAPQTHVARSCIGHTRWATHGEVNDENSHPHHNEMISVVHNGIIENAGELKNELLDAGELFLSETDSEVFLVLLSRELKSGVELKKALATSLKRIRGNSAFVILDKASSDIWAVKRGAPLVCGIRDISSEVLVSSDPYALAGLVDKLYFPDDEVICHLSEGNKNLLNFYDLDLKKTQNYFSKKQTHELEISDKGEFEHFMLKEIHEQPELIRALTHYYFGGEGRKELEEVSKTTPERIHFAACGTAYYASCVVKEFVERLNRIPCDVDLASEFRYRNPILRSGDMGIFLSQSGETADTLAAQNLCKEKGLTTLSFVNVEGSTLFRQCDHNLIIRAGVEIGVASTKAFTQMALLGKIYCEALEGILSDEKRQVELTKQFSLLAERIDELLLNVEKIKDIAKQIYNKKGFFYTGRGVYFSIALEGALKLKEIAYVHAEGYAAGELKHGPIALIDEEMVNIAIITPELYEKTLSNIQEVKARKGVIVAIASKNDQEIKDICDHVIELNFDELGDLTPLYVNVANQLLAYYMAKNKGTDIDKPRNLAKSVTVE